MKILLAVAAVAVLAYFGYKKFSKKKEAPVAEPKKDLDIKVEEKVEESPVLDVVVEAKPARKPAAKKPAAKKPVAKAPKKAKEETKKVNKAKK
jgi:hypothetical protein